MYSMFNLFFDKHADRPIYVISDSEMNELQKTKFQEELDQITDQRERLEKAYKALVNILKIGEKS